MKLTVEGKWKESCIQRDGYYALATEDIPESVEVRMFLSPQLLEDVEIDIYPQVVNAAKFPGAKLVVITPDVHHGYGVPIGCVILTDADEGCVAMGPVGYDIACGMASAKSNVPYESATPEKRLEFNRNVMRRVDTGMGGKSRTLRGLEGAEFERIIRGGAEYYTEAYGDKVDRSKAERHRLDVDDSWSIPTGGKGHPERGISQLGSLGGGNHFIELQRSLQTGTLFVQIHTGSRGFGHGMATNYFELAKAERPDDIESLDLGYFLPDSAYYRDYINAVAAGANFAIVNRMILIEQVARAFQETFGGELELIYEISHNLVQREHHPDYGQVNVHRKGATRALPAGHPNLAGSVWENMGHPVLIPGSNNDYSFILTPLESAVKSGYSVNHGAGRRMSRKKAKSEFAQDTVNAIYREAGIVVNSDGRVPLDESGGCYKSSREVVDTVVNAGLARIEHELLPLASIKGA